MPLRQHGIRPERCLVIEDSLSGVVAAQAAGMPVVGLSAAAIVVLVMPTPCATRGAWRCSRGWARSRNISMSHPDIAIHSLLEGATRATGTVAVIDVFRAFTTAAVAFANGADQIIMVSSIEEALTLRDAGIGQVCMGEVRGRAPDEFDFGNSPFEISEIDFTGKTIIQRTSAGTQGVVAAANQADWLYAASLVTADATVRAMLAGAPDHISIIAMGEKV